TITVANAGPSTVRNYIFTEVPQDGETLFAGLFRPELIQSVQPPAGSTCHVEPEHTGTGQDFSAPVCTIPLLAPGETRLFTVRLAIPPDYQPIATPPALTNVAVLIVAAGAETPPANDNLGLPTAPIVRKADGAVPKLGPAATVAGSRVSYFITASNNGPTTATNVVVDDPIPAGLTLVGGDGPCANGFPCTIPTLAPGTTSQTRIDLLVPVDYSGPPTFVNTATIRSDVPDPTPDNNSASVSTLVVPDHADVGVTLTAPTSVPS